MLKVDTAGDSHLSAIQARYTQQTMTQATVDTLLTSHWLPGKWVKHLGQSALTTIETRT